MRAKQLFGHYSLALENRKFYDHDQIWHLYNFLLSPIFQGIIVQMDMIIVLQGRTTTYFVLMTSSTPPQNPCTPPVRKKDHQVTN